MRSRSEPEKIVITGICGRLGLLLARRLHRSEHVIGLDRRPLQGKPKDIEFYQLDIRRKKCEDVFRRNRIKAVCHLGIMHDPRNTAEEHHTFNVVGTQRLLEYCRRYDVPKVVVLSSGNVYGPRPNNAQFLPEDTPLLAGNTFSEIRDLVEVDMYAQSFFWKQNEVETVILRPVHIVGSVHNAASNYLRLERVPTLMGFDPMVQIIHEEDVVTAVSLALRPGIRGIFNVVGPGAVPLSSLIRAAGKKPLAVPHPLFEMAMKWMWKYRVTSFPPPELEHLRYVCTIDGTQARQTLGFEPRYSVQDTLDYLLHDELAAVD